MEETDQCADSKTLDEIDGILLAKGPKMPVC